MATLLTAMKASATSSVELPRGGADSAAGDVSLARSHPQEHILGLHLVPGGKVLMVLCIRDSPEQRLPPKQDLIKEIKHLFLFLLKEP